MKRLSIESIRVWLVVVYFSIAGVSYAGLPEDPSEYAEWQAKMLDAVEQQISLPVEEAVPRLGLWIRQLSNQHNQERGERAVFRAVQSTLLSIPGHAEYYGKRIRDAYEPLKGPNFGSAINSAATEMMYGFKTLEHLPSPETVKVLGEMLSETWELPSPFPEGGLTERVEREYRPPALAQPAMITLGDLSIRDAPWKPIQIAVDLPVAISAWHAWYEEVKSGQRAFSFKGQPVEFRFKTDGTWETIPIPDPPDDGPASQIPVTGERPDKRHSVALVAPSEQSAPAARGSAWIWISGVAAAVLGLLAWLKISRRNG
jgi:hypothetical protein